MKDLTGLRFGRLLVLKRLPRPQTQSYYSIRWLVECFCGARRKVFGSSLRSGNTRSCGCLRNEAARRNIQKVTSRGSGNTRHGKAGTPEWSVWADMRRRCSKPNHPAFARYGGRGIAVCERWQSFENFLVDVGRRPSAAHSLDRINNDENYEPGNVRWATRQAQARNRSSNRLLTAFGRTQTLVAWAEELGMKQERIRMRLDAYGWPVERALSR